MSISSNIEMLARMAGKESKYCKKLIIIIIIL